MRMSFDSLIMAAAAPDSASRSRRDGARRPGPIRAGSTLLDSGKRMSAVGSAHASTGKPYWPADEVDVTQVQHGGLRRGGKIPAAASRVQENSPHFSS